MIQVSLNTREKRRWTAASGTVRRSTGRENAQTKSAALPVRRRAGRLNTGSVSLRAGRRPSGISPFGGGFDTRNTGGNVRENPVPEKLGGNVGGDPVPEMLGGNVRADPVPETLGGNDVRRRDHRDSTPHVVPSGGGGSVPDRKC